MTIKKPTSAQTADQGAGYQHSSAGDRENAGQPANSLQQKTVNHYWRDNKNVLFLLMSIWVFVTFGCGIILGDWLDNYSLGGFPLGFWFTQQGAMLVYVVLIFVYHFWMKRIEARHGVDDSGQSSVDIEQNLGEGGKP